MILGFMLAVSGSLIGISSIIGLYLDVLSEMQRLAGFFLGLFLLIVGTTILTTVGVGRIRVKLQVALPYVLGYSVHYGAGVISLLFLGLWLL